MVTVGYINDPERGDCIARFTDSHEYLIAAKLVAGSARYAGRQSLRWTAQS